MLVMAGSNPINCGELMVVCCIVDFVQLIVILLLHHTPLHSTPMTSMEWRGMKYL